MPEPALGGGAPGNRTALPFIYAEGRPQVRNFGPFRRVPVHVEAAAGSGGTLQYSTGAKFSDIKVDV
jgi:hypothetical protein